MKTLKKRNTKRNFLRNSALLTCGIKTNCFGNFSLSLSRITLQSLDISYYSWLVSGLSLTCASPQSTLEAHKCDNMNVVLQKDAPSCPLPAVVKYWVWHRSNCMGSNQLDTQLKETWRMWAPRQEAWLNSCDVHWTNLLWLPWQNFSFVY